MSSGAVTANTVTFGMLDARSGPRARAARNNISAGLDDADIATVLGWKAERVAEIRRRYVRG